MKKYSREHWMLLVNPFIAHWHKVKPSKTGVYSALGLALGLLIAKIFIAPDAGTIAAMKALGWR